MYIEYLLYVEKYIEKNEIDEKMDMKTEEIIEEMLELDDNEIIKYLKKNMVNEWYGPRNESKITKIWRESFEGIEEYNWSGLVLEQLLYLVCKLKENNCMKQTNNLNTFQ